MKLYQKYIIATLPIVLIGMGAIGYWSFSHSRDALLRTEQRIMVHLLEDAVDQFIDRRFTLLESTNLSGILSFVSKYQSEAFDDLKALGEKTDRRVFVTNREGQVIFCSNCKDTKRLKGWRALALKTSEQTYGAHEATDQDHAVYAAAPYSKPNWNWVIFVTRPMAEVSKEVGAIGTVALGVSLASILAVALMLAWVTRLLLISPIGRLQQAAAAIAIQEKDLKIDINSNDELGQLARDMEHMSASISDYMEVAESSSRAKSNFLATMSHELRTPLTSIKGALGLMNATLSDGLTDDQKNLFQISLRNSDAMLLLINELLDYEKIISGTLIIETSPHDICALTEKIVKDNQGYASSQSVKFNFTQPERPMFAEVQKHRFEQVLRNLLSNAAKFSEPGCDVEITIKNDDGFIIVSVKDDGAGIPDDFKTKIFEQFTQIDSSQTRKHAGTGLGLAISKSLTESMGGMLTFKSVVDVGSTFYICFPEAART